MADDRKVVSLRLDPKLHAKVALIARMDDTTITSLVNNAIVAYVNNRTSNANFATVARKVRDEMVTEHETMLNALSDLTD